MKHKLPIINLMLFCVLTMGAQTRFVGGDISMLPKYEAANVKYFDKNGKTINDLIGYFRDEAGFNIARVRIFVEPDGSTGVVQDLDYVVDLSKRIKNAGINLMLDFHYSDYWADPSHQWTPKHWVSLSESQLVDTIYEYTKDVLATLAAEDASPDFIQIGNEISYGMLWGAEGKQNYRCYTNSDNNWERFRKLLNNASKACRETCPDAKIIIHTERTNNWTATKNIYERLSAVDYDIIGLSYYPEWHNDLNSLTNILKNIHGNFTDKPVMLVETGYFNNWYNKDATYDFTATWAASPAGQKAFLDDLVAAVKDLDYLTSIIYWFPEENPYNNHVYEPWYNHGLFNPNNGRVSDALFSLKAFLDSESGTESINANIDKNTIFTIDGRILTNYENLPHGVYIQNGNKIIR